MRKVRRFLSLSAKDKCLLLKAVVMVFAIRLGLTLLPFSTLQNYLTKDPERGIDPNQKPSIDQVAWSVAAVSHCVPKATCLTRALALQVLLHHEGYPATLQIGVMKDEKGLFQAHAWVESEGKTINTGSEIESYIRLIISNT